jgi:hypothetical protein
MSPRPPVHVVLDLIGHVIVDDVLHPREVEALGRHVCRDKHVLGATLEAADGCDALLLVLVSVHCAHVHTLFG